MQYNTISTWFFFIWFFWLIDNPRSIVLVRSGSDSCMYTERMWRTGYGRRDGYRLSETDSITGTLNSRSTTGTSEMRERWEIFFFVDFMISARLQLRWTVIFCCSGIREGHGILRRGEHPGAIACCIRPIWGETGKKILDYFRLWPYLEKRRHFYNKSSFVFSFEMNSLFPLPFSKCFFLEGTRSCACDLPLWIG